MLEDEGLALVEGEGSSVDVELWVGWSLIWVRDTSEVLDDTITGLLVESLDISALADLEGSADVALVELKTSFGMDLSGEVSVFGVW